MAAVWRVQLLGRLRAEWQENVLTRFRTRQTATLFAYLSFYRSQAHPRELLVSLLWPECAEEPGRHRLSVALSWLRRRLEPAGVPHGSVIQADRFSVQLNPETVLTDVAAFEAALQSAESASSDVERALFLGPAVELYQGELLPGCYEEWCLEERERLAQLYADALRRWIASLDANGDLDRAIRHARRAVHLDPLREEPHRTLMRLLAAAGQPEAALHQYRALERLMQHELGEPPSPSTRQLAAEIGSADVGGVASELSGAVPLPAATPWPSGTVTLLLVAIEGTPAASAAFHTLLRELCHRFGGVAKLREDGALIAFDRASSAVACALALRQALRVRMALHTGEAEPGRGDYPGAVREHAERLLTLARDGKILCSQQTALLLPAGPEPPPRLIRLGLRTVPGARAPELLFEVESGSPN